MNRKINQITDSIPGGGEKGQRPERLGKLLKGITFKDAVAGLTLSIPSIPDVMASGVLAGVNPIYGLYSLMIGTPVGTIFTGSVFINVVTTGAMSIAIAGGVASYQGDELVNALVTVALVVGILQVAAGLLRLGFLTRFVSNSVIIGISGHIYNQLENTGLLGKLGEKNVYSSTEIVTESLRRAIADAQEWISSRSHDKK